MHIPRHIKSQCTRRYLARVRKMCKRRRETVALLRRAMVIDEQSYGAEHPTVAIDLNNLAQLLQATNRLAWAEPLMRRCVAIFDTFKTGTGYEHPDAHSARSNLANIQHTHFGCGFFVVGVVVLAWLEWIWIR